MTFIIILIALIIERFLHWSHLRHWGWFTRYQYFLNIRLGTWSKPLLLAACVLPPAIIIGLVGYLLSGWLYNLPELIFGVVVLVYCLGPGNLWVQIYSCIRSLNTNDPHLAIEEVKNTFNIPSIDQPQAFHQVFTRSIFIAANQRIFAVVFWFALLGPLGAVLYRAVSLCAANPTMGASQAAMQTQRVLDWLPIRVFTFIFALGGHFTKVFICWKKYAKEGVSYNDVMLGECGIDALWITDDENLPEDGSAEKEALALLDRVFVIGLVILAVLVLVT